MTFCNNTNFTLPKQSQRSRSILQDGSRSLGLFWKEKTQSYNQRNTVCCLAIFTMDNNFQGFLFTSQEKEALQIWGLLLKKRICS